MPASIFSGTKVKLLKKVAQLFTGSEIHSSTVDPTASAVSAPIGSLLMNETTGNVYRKLDAGSSTNWSLLGAGSGAGVNLMKLDASFKEAKPQNADFELSIGDWVAYADAADIMPVDMTGGAPNTTIARSTATPLNGAAHALVTVTTGASRQGEGVSCVVNIPPAYRGKSLTLRFPFQTTGTLVEDDFKLYAYDVTNSVLITPYAAGKILGANGMAQANIAVPTSCASLRVGIHIARTSTGAATILFDDVSLSSDSIPAGLAGSDSIDVSNLVSFDGIGTPTNVKVYEQRVGDKARYYGTVSSGTTAATTFAIVLPSGRAIDYNKLSTENNGSIVGRGQTVYNSGTDTLKDSDYPVFVDGSTTDKVFIAYQYGTSGLFKALGAALIFSNEPFSFFFEVPISGWSSNISMAESSTFLISSYLANGTRVTGTAPARLGEYRSYLRNASARTYTETNGAPGTAPTSVDGIVYYAGNAWGSADTNNAPTRYEIFVGKNKKVKYLEYVSAGRTGFISSDMFPFSTYDVGVAKHYDPVTGIFSLVRPTILGGGATSGHILGVNNVGDSSGASQLYFDIEVSENALAVGTQQPRSEVWVTVANGYGSTNTVIRRWTNTKKSTGSAITYADSATLGGSFTINEDGVYAISYNDQLNTTDKFGISVNSTQLTTDISSINSDHRVAVFSTTGANYGGYCGVTMELRAGDVVRAHGNGTASGVNTFYELFRIAKVSN